MRSIRASALLAGAFSVWTFAGAIADAQSAPAAILSTLEVQRLVASSAPADHARLAAHFDALADTYAVEAKRHSSMAQRYAGNPNRDVAGLGAHCRRLADLNTESATAVRDLAAHHKKLSAGAPSVAPTDDARFDAGKGAAAPSIDEVIALAATARTPADHQALAGHFLTLAKRYATDADNHAALARAYRSPRAAGNAAMAAHCERLTTLLRTSAKEANEAAAMHRTLSAAGVGR